VAASITPADLMDSIPVYEVEEKKKLQRHFARFDILFFLICTLVGLDTIGSVAANGPQGFTWLAILAIVFFIPYALLTSELGTAFPEEGGSYVWTRLAFGRKVAAVNAVIYWVSNPIWVGGTLGILALTVFQDFFNGSQALPGPSIGGWFTVGQLAFVLGFIWLSVWSAILSFNVGKWVPTIGAFVRVAILGMFVVSVVIFGIENGVQGFGVSGGGFAPTWVGFIGLVPVLFFNYVGFELPSAAGEEMNDAQHDVPFGVFRSAVGAVLLYGLPILAILLVLPKDRITALSGLGQILGDVAALAFILALFTSGTTWIMGADRAQAMAALDGSAPPILGRISSRFGTPIAVNLLSGIVATVVMVLAFMMAGGDANKYFAAVLGLTISTTTISYLGIFPALLKLRLSHPHVPRPYRVPGGLGGVAVVTALTTLFAALATIGLLWPGFGTDNPDSHLPSGFERLPYEVTQLVPLLVILGVGVLFYVAGGGTRKKMVTVTLEEEVAHQAS
jgi:amino acid transporter